MLKRFYMIVNTQKNHKIPLNDYESLLFYKFNDKSVDEKTYQQLINNLMYAAVYTRPNIAFAVNKLNQFMIHFFYNICTQREACCSICEKKNIYRLFRPD